MGKRQKKQSSGAPAWMATFADMATLLMSFFVLLLAFSEMDVVKYKAISGSMKQALGVKADSMEITLPEGKPAEIPEIRGESKPRPDAPDGSDNVLKGEHLSPEEILIRDKLAEELKNDKLQVEVVPRHVIIRLPEQGVFRSGKATLERQYLPVLEKIRDVLAQTHGSIVVAGHTDDRPISNARFRSNWDLSASRAASVVHVLLADGSIVRPRIVAHGYSDTRPIARNDTHENRAKNRRVEIILATKGGKSGRYRKEVDQGSAEGSPEIDVRPEQGGPRPPESTDADATLGGDAPAEGSKSLEQPLPPPPEPDASPSDPDHPSEAPPPVDTPEP